MSSRLPTAAFVDPSGRNRKEVRRIGGLWMRDVVDLLASAAGRPPAPVTVFEAKLLFPEQGQRWTEIRGLAKRLFEASLNPSNPGYFGHMNTLPSFVSVIGELVTAALDNNVLSVETAPALSRLERDLMRHFGVAFGLGEGSGGVLVGGGSVANLQALAVARNVAFGTHEGPLNSARPGVILASDQAHVSIRKAAMILGLGEGAVVSVATDACFRMDSQRLRAAIKQTRDEGRQPFCIVATAGTTGTGSIDPLEETAAVARESGLWLHVDAAYAGALRFSDRERFRLAGIEHADSLIFNPHKWFFVARNCSMVLFRDATVLMERFRIPLPYMSADAELTNIGEISVHGTQHADVLKLWLSLLLFGRTGLARLVEGSCALGRVLAAAIEARPLLAMATRPDTNIVCFRPAPRQGKSSLELDQLVMSLRQKLLEKERIFVSLQPLRGSKWLRVVPLNPYSGEPEIERLLAVVDG